MATGLTAFSAPVLEQRDDYRLCMIFLAKDLGCFEAETGRRELICRFFRHHVFLSLTLVVGKACVLSPPLLLVERNVFFAREEGTFAILSL